MCLSCQAQLGYDPYAALLMPLEPGAANGSWQAVEGYGPRKLYYRCGNFNSPAACNWLVSADKEGRPTRKLCASCRLNRMIPDLSRPENHELWLKVEMAKRRMVSEVMAIGLRARSKIEEDPERGLAFDIIQSLPGGPRVMTGHANGLITINLDEADDAKREGTRVQMHEPYRTLLGHLRHEVGHYYWDRLICHSDWLGPYRELFGDERQDYGEALQRHYANGPRPDWPQHFVSAYATSHPWEDWAETWAHYLHMVDTLCTASSFGIDSAHVPLKWEFFTREALWKVEDPQGENFLSFVNEWVTLSAVLNELSRGMGHPDFYPFVLTQDVVKKLHFIHLVVGDAAAHGDSLKEIPEITPEGAEDTMQRTPFMA